MWDTYFKNFFGYIPIITSNFASIDQILTGLSERNCKYVFNIYHLKLLPRKVKLCVFKLRREVPVRYKEEHRII